MAAGKRGISRILKGPEILPFIIKWEEEQGKGEKDQDLGKKIKTTHTTAIDSNTI